jgi:hypothetical protein
MQTPFEHDVMRECLCLVDLALVLCMLCILSARAYQA